MAIFRHLERVQTQVLGNWICFRQVLLDVEAHETPNFNHYATDDVLRPVYILLTLNIFSRTQD
jgi:hypothetical protein